MEPRPIPRAPPFEGEMGLVLWRRALGIISGCPGEFHGGPLTVHYCLTENTRRRPIMTRSFSSLDPPLPDDTFGNTREGRRPLDEFICYPIFCIPSLLPPSVRYLPLFPSDDNHFGRSYSISQFQSIIRNIKICFNLRGGRLLLFDPPPRGFVKPLFCGSATTTRQEV